MGISLEDPIPDHTTVTKNYERFHEQGLCEEFFRLILEMIDAEGLIEYDQLFVDGTHVKANANVHKYIRVDKEPASRPYDDELKEAIDEVRAQKGKNPLKEKVCKKDEVAVDPFIEEERLFEELKIKEFYEDEPKELEDYGELIESFLKEERSGDIFEAARLNKEDLDLLKDEEIRRLLLELKELGEISIPETCIENGGDSEPKKNSPKTLISTSDPESGIFHKGEHKKQFAYNS